MRFIRLELLNFASYYGKHTLDFNTSAKKTVAVVVGGNGGGKTSIFDALNWALYGEDYEKVLVETMQKTIVDFVNETALMESTAAGEGVEMSCTLFFSHEGSEYRIEQALVAKKQRDRVEVTDRTCALYDVSTGNHQEIKAISTFLNGALPGNVRDYFLFNGDRINQLSLPGSSKEIRDGIYRVVDLELLQRGAEHLRDSANIFRKRAKAASTGELAEVESRNGAAIAEQDSLRKRQVELSDEEQSISNEIEVIEGKLRGMKGTMDLQREHDRLKLLYASAKKDQQQLGVDLRTAAAVASLGVGIESIDILANTLDEQRNKGEIPSSISAHLLRDILELKKCICGTEFEKGDTVYLELERRLQHELEKQGRGQDLLKLLFDLRDTKTEILAARMRLVELEKSRSKLEAQVTETHRLLDELDNKLRDVPEEDSAKLTDALHQLRVDHTDARIKFSEAVRRIQDLQVEIDELQSRREQLAKKQSEALRHILRDQLAQGAAEELQRIFEKFAEDSRLEVEHLTREEFYKFIPSARALKVGIDSEFHYDVRGADGAPVLQQLANGQKQALSLAYITSISRVSEKNPPLVIDMPFGRLDADVQENIARRLPELASQVILLMLPGTEWNKRTQEIFGDSVSDVYELSFDDKQRQTSILRKG